MTQHVRIFLDEVEGLVRREEARNELQPYLLSTLTEVETVLAHFNELIERLYGQPLMFSDLQEIYDLWLSAAHILVIKEIRFKRLMPRSARDVDYSFNTPLGLRNAMDLLTPGPELDGGSYAFNVTLGS